MAIIKIPRERNGGQRHCVVVLVPEVGHQAAALLSLVESLRPMLRSAGMEQHPAEAAAWQLWERWISEIVADLWSVGRVGISSTLGLMGVVSLPRAFVFRLNPDDPHPAPWIRVKLSAALGRAFYPQDAWTQLARTLGVVLPAWHGAGKQRDLFMLLERTIPKLVSVLIHHRPAALRGGTVRQALDTDLVLAAVAVLRALLAAHWSARRNRCTGLVPSSCLPRLA